MRLPSSTEDVRVAAQKERHLVMILERRATPGQISDWLEKVRARWKQPGLGLGLIRDGEIVLTTGRGLRKSGQDGDVDEASLFALASLSKSFVAAAIGCLSDQGRLGWDDRVQTHLPWFELSDPWVSQHVTVRDLLCNRLGLLPSEGRHRKAAATRRQLIERMRGQPFRHGFREEYGYCTDGYTIAGEIIEVVSGEGWDSFIRRTFWEPLGMDDTNADHIYSREQINACCPHWMVDGKAEPILWEYQDNTAAPAGGVNSSVRDITRWLAVNLDQGRFGRRVIIPRPVLDEITAPQTPERGTYAENELSCVVGRGEDGIEDQAYGMGWYVHRYKSIRTLCHSGRIDGFCSFMMQVPEFKFGVVVLANANNVFLPRAIAQSLCDWAIGSPPVDWTEKFFDHQTGLDAQARLAEADFTRLKTGRRAGRPLDAYCGRYIDQTGFGEGVLHLSGENLVLTLGPLRLSLRHWDGDVFEALSRGSIPRRQFLLEFNAECSGRITCFSTDQQARFVRVEDR